MIDRIINPIKRKISLLIGRAIITAVDNTKKTQTLQLECLRNERLSKVERLQEYGFDSYPKLEGNEALVLFINGNRDFGIVIKAANRHYRPTNLVEGDVCVYDYRGNKITLNNAGIKAECLNGNIIEMVSGEVKVNGTNLEVLQ